MRGLITTLASAIMLVGCGSSGATSEDAEPSPPDVEGVTNIYFTAGEQLRKTPVSATDPESAARALLNGPDDARGDDAETQIPAATILDGVAVDRDGTATVRLSRGFTQGIPDNPSARSANEQSELDARLAQLTFTLTSLDDVDQAKVVSGGISIGGPRSRRDFQKPQPQAPKRKLADFKPKGVASSSVRGLQRRLAELRYLPKGAVDGIDGYRTRQAVTAFQAWEGLHRDGIAGPETMSALNNAKRPKPKGDGPSRRIEVFRDKGVTLLVKKGRATRVIHTSSGASGYTTPAGTFEVFRKEVNSWSVPYQTWLPFASYFNAGIAFHAYPEVPAYPASHGCVRVPEPEAEHLYAFARIGTAVLVF